MRTLPVKRRTNLQLPPDGSQVFLPAANWAAVFQATTRIPGSLVRAWISSSVRPSLKYSFSGRTEIDEGQHRDGRQLASARDPRATRWRPLPADHRRALRRGPRGRSIRAMEARRIASA